MAENNGNQGGSMANGLLLGLAIGAVAGLAIGVLFAPQSGSETREMIKEKAGDARNRAGEFVETVRNRTSRAIGAIQDKDDHS